MISQRVLRFCTVCVFSLLLVISETGCSSSNQQKSPPVQPPPTPVNNSPVISALKATPQVQALDKTQIICEATDADSDNLTYSWTASGGILDGSAKAVTWTAPSKSGSYKITVIVSDNLGASATRDVVITVPEKPNNPPIISSIKFTRPNHLPTTIKPNMTEKEKDKNPDPLIRIYETGEISCLATDPDGDNIDYVWIASGGSIKGRGPTVQWIAPGAGGMYTVTCDVSDGRGGTDTFTINVTVKCCGI